MTETLLRTKLTPPPLRGQIVERPRLVEKLAQALDVPLTLVSAPAGFGKTTAVVSASRRLRHEGGNAPKLAWLSLQESDDDPLRFWRYVGAALQNSGQPGQSLIAALDTPQPPPLAPVLAALINELAAAASPVLLVLDDYHLITQREIHDQVAFLVEHGPANLHLLLATRADPPLPLHRLRARGQLLEIRVADLRFTRDEAAALLARLLDLPLSDHEIAQLAERTEGWAAGLQLAALALHGTTGGPEPPHDLIDRLAQSDQYILDYLAEEVLAQQPAATQSFLLYTSILPALCAELCNAVTGAAHGATMLETLTAQNLFVTPVDPPQAGQPARRWYRYHRLFADLLQGHLRRRHLDLIPILHRRAAAWYAAHGDPETAIEHAFAGEDIPLAARLLDEYARDAVMQGRVRMVEQWLQRLPETWRYRLPRATLAFAWALLLRGQYAALAPHLARAAAALDDHPTLRGEYHALRASLADTLGKAAEALVHAEQAVAAIAPDDHFTQAAAQVALGGARRALGDVPGAMAAYEQAIPLCRAAKLPVPEMLARAHLGYLCLLSGQLRRAEAVARPVADAGIRHPAAATVLSLLATVLIEWNRLDEAAQQLQVAFALAQAGGHNATLVNLHIAQARLARAQGELTAAQAALEEAATLLQLGAPAWLHPLLLAEQVHLWLAQGAIATAAHALQTTRGEQRGHVRDMLPLTQARLLLQQGTPATLGQALAILDAVLTDAARDGRLGNVLEARLLRALVLAAQGERSAALQELAHALDLAQPEGAVRLFLEAGAPLVPLLAQSPHPYAKQLLPLLPHSGQDEAAIEQDETLLEPLTAREIEVLRAMARGLTYQQIADELLVSVNTVRHHVKGLYGKLQVNKATLAVEKAQSLGLL